MTNIDSLAEALFGSKRAETQEVLTDATTRTYIGTALTDSVDGTVMVDLGGDVTLPDDIEGVSEHSAEGVEVATGPGVRAGDEVVVTLVGGTPLKTPMVTGVAGEGDEQDARIATASAAAEAAWDWADEAHDAATDAQESADEAQASASSAASAASAAVISAASAEASAQQAIADAAAASSSAASAEASAQQAISDANDAHDAAVAAQAEATLATQSANEAKGAATRANTAANDALTQLATVEDVIGVVDWVTEHGTYSLTTDTAIDPDKVYYTRTGSGTQADPYVYTAVAEPDVSDIGSYYELDIDEALSQYVASHLALTNAGLYVLKDSSGYKLLLANDGMQVIDPAGHTVATYGESITFDSERPQRIGGTDSYIEWRDTDSDGVPDSLAIVADSIELSGGQSVSTGSGNVWANHSSATSASGISSWSDTFVAPTTAKPYVWMKSYSIIDGQRVYGNPACISGATGQQGPQGPQGETGDTGVGIQSYVQMWAKSTSSSVAPTSGWSASRPTSIGTNEHLWVRIDTTWTDTTTTQGTPVVDQNTTDLWHTSAALRVDVDSIGSDVSALQTTVSGHTTTISQHTTAIQQNATDISLRATKTEAYQLSQPNMAPLFSMDHSSLYNATTNPSGYWRTRLDTNGFMQLEDGWTHFEYDNTGGSALVYKYVRPARVSSIVAGAPYTILIEVRNNAPTGTGTHDFYLQQIANNQFWGTIAGETIDDDHTTTTANVNLLTCGESVTVHSYRLADTAHLTDDTGFLFTFTARTAVGATNNFDVRLSLYEGIYDGPYKPYVGANLYASQSELKVQTDRIGMVVSNTDASSSLALTADAMEYIGDHVEIKGTDGTSTVISGGKVQANSIGANELNATSINASNSLTVGAFNTSTQNDILNSNVQVGGRNLLPKTGSADGYYANTVPSGNHLTFVDDDGECYERSVTSTSANIPMSSNVALVGLESGSEYTISMMVKSTVARTFGLQLRKNNNGADGGEYVHQPDVNVAANTWTRLTYSFTGTSDAAVYARLYCAAGTACTVRMRELQLERGNKATDWSPAPEDQTAYVDDSISSLQVGGRNLATGTANSTDFTCGSAVTYFAPIGFYPTSDIGLNLLKDTSNTKFTLSFDWSTADVTTAYNMFPSFKYTSTSYVSLTGGPTISIPTGASSGHYEYTFEPTSAQRTYGTMWLLSKNNNNTTQCGTVTISNFMFECANKASTWTPAPEDMATAESLAGTNESLEGAITDIGELSDQLVGTVTEQNKTITDIQTYLNSLRQDLDAEIQSRQQWLNFNSAEGLVIGAAGSTFKTVTTNTSQQFRSGGTVLAETSGTEFVAPIMRSDQLLIGDWMWTRRDNGNLSLKWIG